MKKAAKKSTKKAKKSFSLKEKLIMLICCVTMTGSGVTIATYAAMTWDAPADVNDSLLITETGTVDGSLESYAPGRPPTDCCGTANKTYGCNENSFTSTTTTSTIGVFCKPPAVRSIFPKVINFPKPGETVKWNCICKTPGGGPVVALDGKPVVSSCAAKREIPACSLASERKNIFLDKETYRKLFFDDNGHLLTGSAIYNNSFFNNLCSGGEIDVVSYGYIGNLGDEKAKGCISVDYLCPCKKTAQHEYYHDGVYSVCRTRYCEDKTDPTLDDWGKRRRCGDHILDEDLGEECEQGQAVGLYDGLFSKTCANSSTKGACGGLKCTNDCKIDDSGCYPCPPTSGGVFTD